MRKWWHFAIATGFGAGYSPYAPGTVGSVLALLLAYFFISPRSWAFFLLIFLSFFLGVMSANKVEEYVADTDPSIIVIDEVVGMWIGLWGLPQNIFLFFLAFVLFRYFDIHKPLGLNRLQALPGGWGVMVDDAGAGIYTLAITQIVYFVVRVIF